MLKNKIVLLKIADQCFFVWHLLPCLSFFFIIVTFKMYDANLDLDRETTV